MSARKPPVIIFGGTGFVGRSLEKWFAERGRVVIPLSSKACDATDLNAIFRALETGSDVVFCSVINRAVENSPQAKESNLRMIRNLVAATRKKPPRSLAFLSSVDVYGFHPPQGVSELTPPHPEDPYGEAKLESETILREAKLPFPRAIFRLPGVFGPFDGQKSVIGKLALKILRNEEIPLTEGGTMRRDFLPVDDLCQVIETYFQSPHSLLLNIVGDQSLSIRDWAEKIASIAGLPLRTKNVPAEVDSRPKYDLTFDDSEIRRVFPSLPRVGAEEGIRLYIQSLSF